MPGPSTLHDTGVRLHVLSGGRLRVKKGVFTPGRDDARLIE